MMIMARIQIFMIKYQISYYHEAMQKITSNRQICPVTAAIDVVGGKWKPLIIYYLMPKTLRFNELRRAIPGATAQMLTLQLRELERDGIVHREIYREIPPKVEYSLTEMGISLQPVVEAMIAWGHMYLGLHETAPHESAEGST